MRNEKDKSIAEGFRRLNIIPEPLLKYYTPEIYARELLRRSGARKGGKVVFSSEIDYVEDE